MSTQRCTVALRRSCTSVISRSRASLARAAAAEAPAQAQLALEVTKPLPWVHAQTCRIVPCRCQTAKQCGRSLAGTAGDAPCNGLQPILAMVYSQIVAQDDEFKRHFLAHYWQKSPLLIRRAYPTGWRSPVEPDELAGFACAGNGGGVADEDNDDDGSSGGAAGDSAEGDSGDAAAARADAEGGDEDEDEDGDEEGDYGDEESGELLSRVVVQVRRRSCSASAAPSPAVRLGVLEPRMQCTALVHGMGFVVAKG